MKRILFIIAALFVAAAASGQTPLPNDPAVKVGKLENGMTYYIRHNEQPAQRAEFWLATNVGAYQEEDHQDGLAHFLEHMCFNGTKNFPDKAMLEYLQSIGAEFGRNINASTGFEVTQYMLNNIPVVRESIVDSCLLVLHDWAHYVTCDPAEIDNERGVIVEERRSHDGADWRMFEASLPYLFGDAPYSKRTLIGSYEQLKTFKHESLTDFYHKWYNPDMQAVIVVGDIDVDAVEAKIKSMFGSIPAPETPTTKVPVKIANNTEPVVGIITDPEATNSYIELLWKSEPMPEIFNSTLEGKMISIVKTYIRMIMGERFNDIASQPNAPFLGGGIYFYPLCEECDALRGQVMFKDGDAVNALTAFMLEIEKMKRFGFTEGEVQRAKDNIISRYEKAVEAAPTRKNGDLVQPLLNHFYDNNAYMEPATELEVVKMICEQAINTQMLNQLAAQVITDDNLIVLYNGPEKDGLVNPTKEQILDVIAAAKTAEIQANAEENLNEPFISGKLKGSKVKKEAQTIYGATEWTLKNGVKVVVLPTQHKKDQVLFNISLDGGKTLIATEDMVAFEDNIWSLFLSNSGISKFAGTAVPKMLAGKTLSVEPYISNIRHGVQGQSTPKDLETALQLVYLYFTDPRFDENEYQIGIQQINALLPNLSTNPDFLFNIAMDETLYGNNPRVVPLNEETVAKANLATIERVYRELFKDAAGATLTIVGNVDLATLKPMVEKYIGSLPKGKKADVINRDNVISLAKGQVDRDVKLVMQTPKSTALKMYSAYVPFTMKNKVALEAANYILDMIYTKTIREDQGGTYGVGTAAVAMNEPEERALIQIYFNTNPESVKKLSEIAVAGLKDLAENGPTQEQFNKAVENSKKNIPESRISNGYWMTSLNNWYRFGSDYDKEYEEAVNTLTPEDIKAALQAILAQGNVISVTSYPAE